MRLLSNQTDRRDGVVSVAVSKLAIIGKTPVNFQAGLGYWLESPRAGPEEWRARFQIQFVFPKK